LIKPLFETSIGASAAAMLQFGAAGLVRAAVEVRWLV
jgi:hypothetical protein